MTRNRWNLLLGLLLVLNLLRWPLAGPWSRPAAAHPAAEDTGSPVPDTMITTYDEEWEATEFAGTSEDGNFSVVPFNRAAGQPSWTIDKLGVTTMVRFGGPGHGPDKGLVSAGGAAALTVARWRVRGHMHRARGK